MPNPYLYAESLGGGNPFSADEFMSMDSSKLMGSAGSTWGSKTPWQGESGLDPSAVGAKGAESSALSGVMGGILGMLLSSIKLGGPEKRPSSQMSIDQMLQYMVGGGPAGGQGKF